MNIQRYTFLAIALLASAITQAQKDTTGKGAIEITSSFKPVLKESAKINFSAAPPPADTTRPVLKYSIPNQNLLFALQPGSLKPLALGVDTNGAFNNSSYVKAGFGSLRTPFFQTGISFGDGKTAGLNIYAKHVGSDGKREFQKFSNTNAKLSGYFRSGNNLQWDASLGMQQFRTYKYGYLPETLNFPNDSLKQQFSTIAGTVGFHNIKKTDFGLSYSPQVKIDIFNDNLKNSESNTVVNLPLQKSIGTDLTINLGLTFDLTRLSPKDKSAFNNTMYYISPSVLYKTAAFDVQAGIRPSWDNKTFKMFPNILANIVTSDKRFTFQAGWTGYIRKTTYQYLASQNPWLRIPQNFINSWIEERFAGFKGSVGEHFSYSAKVAFNKVNNQPLFVNDTSSLDGGKTFNVVNESRMNVVNLGGEIGYTVHEKLSLLAGLTFNQYTGLKDNAEAWGMIPLELKASMRIQVIDKLWLKTDLYGWTGPQYRKKDGSAGRLGGATDLNAGLEFKVSKNVNLWTQFNNIFNKEYQRWNQYPVYGFNFTGGVTFNFDQKNK